MQNLHLNLWLKYPFSEIPNKRGADILKSHINMQNQLV